MGMILFRDCANTYAREEIVAVWMTVKRDHPYMNAKNLL
jgi:hypothetical protein